MTMNLIKNILAFNKNVLLLGNAEMNEFTNGLL